MHFMMKFVLLALVLLSTVSAARTKSKPDPEKRRLWEGGYGGKKGGYGGYGGKKGGYGGYGGKKGGYGGYGGKKGGYASPPPPKKFINPQVNIPAICYSKDIFLHANATVEFDDQVSKDGETAYVNVGLVKVKQGESLLVDVTTTNALLLDAEHCFMRGDDSDLDYDASLFIYMSAYLDCYETGKVYSIPHGAVPIAAKVVEYDYQVDNGLLIINEDEVYHKRTTTGKFYFPDITHYYYDVCDLDIRFDLSAFLYQGGGMECDPLEAEAYLEDWLISVTRLSHESGGYCSAEFVDEDPFWPFEGEFNGEEEVEVEFDGEV